MEMTTTLDKPMNTYNVNYDVCLLYTSDAADE